MIKSVIELDLSTEIIISITEETVRHADSEPHYRPMESAL